MPDTHVLSFHAGYRCGHSKRCCSSGWPIEVTAQERAPLERALRTGVLEPTVGDAFMVAKGLEVNPAARLLRIQNNRCVFCDDAPHGGCRIHRALGHEALPLPCRQFPRHVVTDPRGVSVTLSHYCPTAAGLLTASAPPHSLVVNPPAFPVEGEYVGLTADPTLPPLVHPTLAMDWKSWWHFEQQSLDLIADAPQPLERLAVAVEEARRWKVGRGTLTAHIDHAFARARSATELPGRLVDNARVTDARQLVLAAVPQKWQSHAAAALDGPAQRSLSDQLWRRFLAAHAFANWTAYLGEGVRVWFTSVQTAACLLVHTGDPGQVDLVLRHLADSSALVARWNPLEKRSLL